MTAKKSGTFMVYLKSMKRNVASGGGSSGWGEGEMYAIGLEIRDLFQRVVGSSSSPFASADFTWEGSPAAIRPHELLVSHPIKATATNVHKSGGAGLALENPGSQDLTPRNIALMAAHLTLEIPQWTGGLLQHF
jgi:hypothetical protein